MRETPKQTKPGENTVAVDFDGVLCDYNEGWKGPYIFGEPLEGALEFLDALLTRDYEVVIFTCRAEYPGMDIAIRDWLVLKGFPKELADMIRVTNVKPNAILYLDDRAINFSGEYPSMKEIETFTPWYKQ